MLVLPKGTFEIEPAVEYEYGGTNALTLVNLTGTPQVAQENLKRDRIEPRITFRAGLPATTTVEARLPFVYVREDRTIAGAPGTVHDEGMGDIELGITKQLVEERPGSMGWLASLNWRLPTGDFRVSEPSPGSGFAALQAGLTFVKRQDPLVFFGTGSYSYVRQRSHEGIEIDPGDAIGLRLGAILAASPQSALRAAFEVNRAARTKFDGVKRPGSDTVAATLQFGLGMLLSARQLLDFQVDVGVTDDAPDFRITAALPIRF